MRSLVCVGVGLSHMSLYHSAPAIADSSVASVWSGYRGLGIKDRVGRLPSSHPGTLSAEHRLRNSSDVITRHDESASPTDLDHGRRRSRQHVGGGSRSWNWLERTKQEVHDLIAELRARHAD